MTEDNEKMIITIDGLAASGKCTLARSLATHFNLPYMDTGKIYRYVAFNILIYKFDSNDIENIIKLIGALDYSNIPQTSELHSEEIGEMASKIAIIPEIRKALLHVQKNFAYNSTVGAVLDGRDTGTVICPDAKYKFYIMARINIRAKRRFKELQARKKSVMYRLILRKIIIRDKRDRTRKSAPVKIAKGAVVIDTSDMNPQEVFRKVMCFISY